MSVFAASAPAESTHDRMVIKIGALVDQTGASTSPLFTKAVELASLQMNDALKHRGARVEFQVLFGDTRSNANLARSNAVRLINDEGVVGLVTAGSGETVGVNKLNYGDTSLPARVQQVPITCFMCSSGFINNPTMVDPDPLTQAATRDLDGWLFRVFYNSNYEAAALSQIIVQATGGDTNGDGVLKVGILADAGHKALATAIGPTLPNFTSVPTSVQIVYNTALANLPADWATVVAGAPDVVVMSMMPGSAAEGIKAYRAGGYTLPILSNNSFRRDYILADPTVGTVANGLEGSSVMLVDPSASGEAFFNAFQAYTGQKPELTSSGAYDGTVTLMLAALVAAGDLHSPTEVTAAAVRQGLAQINDPRAYEIRPSVYDFSKAAQLIQHGGPVNYEGAYNPDDWNAVGDIFPPLVHWKVESGQFVEYEQFQCNPQRPLCQ